MTKWKKNEVEVLELLNKFDGSDFKLSTDSKSVYDISGTSNGVKTLVEVKSRRQMWPKLWIETAKLKSLFAFGKDNTDEEFDVYLVVSVDGKHYCYDAKLLWTEGERKTERMNKRTAFGAQNKVEKEVIEFDHSWYKVELSEQKLGHRYEN